MDFIPNTARDRKKMLKDIGVDSVSSLFCDIPESIRLKSLLKIPKGMPELGLRKHMQKLAEKNNTNILCFAGAGAYDHFVPAIVDHMISRSEFYTAYTPYQAEISQGILQAMFEYQTMICELTGMDISNASMYDGASALAEAALMCTARTGKKQIIITETVHPEYRETLRTYAKANSVDIIEIGSKNGRTDIEKLRIAVSEKTAGVLIQSPNFFGVVEDMERIGKIAHEKGAVFIAATIETTSLGMLKTPGEAGADIFAGEGQSLGNALNFGGPGLGIIAAKKEFMRLIPGRLVGETVDTEGKTGYVLTLQAREQHIRREKATSNICTNVALCALGAAVYMTAMGKQLKGLSELNYHKAHYAYNELKKLDNVSEVFTNDFYNEFVVRIKNAREIFKNAEKLGVIPGILLENHHQELKDCLLINVTEIMEKTDIDRLLGVFR